MFPPLSLSARASAFRRVKSGVLSLLKRYILDMENAESAKRNNSRVLLFIMVVVIVIVQIYGKKSLYENINNVLL